MLIHRDVKPWIKSGMSVIYRIDVAHEWITATVRERTKSAVFLQADTDVLGLLTRWYSISEIQIEERKNLT